MSGPGETFVITVLMDGVAQTEAGAAKVTASVREMGVASKEAGAQGASSLGNYSAATRRAEASSASLSRRLTATGTTAAATGKKLTHGLTLPLLGVAAVAGKMSLDFNKSMLLVSTQAGATHKEVERMSSAILKLSAAGRFAQGPKELSEALFDIESVGFRGAKALDTLKASSDLATIGGADLEATTSALTGTLKTGIKGAGNMKDAIGTLNATIGAGKMHMDDLNGAIGTGFLGPAARFGVSLHSVGAALAELTAQGTPANSAATRLRMTMSLLEAPTAKAKTVLKEIGIGSQDLARELEGPKGILGALELLQDHMDGLSRIEQNQLISSAFGGAKSGGTILQLIGNLDDLSKKQQEIVKNSGDIGEALKETNEDPAVQLEKDWSALQAVLIELGNVIIPAITPVIHDISGDIGSVADAFKSLSPATQSWIVKIGFAAAALGPLLSLTGKITKGVGAITGALAATDIAAALSMKGERMAALGMVGQDMGKTLMGGALTGIAVGAGAFAIGNLLTSVLGGDFKDAGFELGGSLIGGVAGFMIGGPVGAAIGAGLGSVGGELVAGLFSGGEAKATMQEELSKAASQAHVARKTLRSSSGQVDSAEAHLVTIGKRQSKVTDEIRAAQKRLNGARQAGNLPEVRREEAHLNELKAKQIHLTQRQYRGETLLYAAKVKNAQDARHERTVEVELIHVREAALEQAKKHEKAMSKAYEQAIAQKKPLKELNEREQDLVQAQNRRKGASEKLKGAEKELGASMKEITQKFGKDFAKQLRDQIPEWGQTVKQMQRGNAELHKLAPNYTTLLDAIGNFKNRQEASTTATGKGTTSLKNFGGAATNAAGKVKQAKTEVVAGFTGMETKSSSFLGALNEPSPFRSAPKKASGGLMEVQGQGNRDTVPITENQVSAMVAPGELLAVINRHQAPLLNRAVHNEYGVDGLSDFFSTYNTPHHLAIGGLVEPKVRAGGAFRGGEQRDLHMGFQAAVKYLRTHDGFGRLVRNGSRMDAMHQPYLWGGGHGASASADGPWDCSGGISELLDGAGFKTTPMVSGGFESYGAVGKGKASILANPEHVYAVLGDRAIGTSGENPGGGFGWIDGYTYRGGFTVRHVDLSGEGNSGGAGRSGKGQPPKKGFAKGGWVKVGFTTYDIDGPGASGHLMSGHGYAELGTAGANAGGNYLGKALGRSGELPMGFPLDVKVGSIGKVGRLKKLDRGSGQPEPFYAIDIHHLAWPDVGLHGNSKGDAFIREVGGSSASGAAPKVSAHAGFKFTGGETSAGGGTYAPGAGQVPTAKLSFGSLPKDRHGVRKELRERRAELGRYQRSYREAKHPDEKAALMVNIKLLQNRIAELLKEQARIAEADRREKITKGLEKRGTFPDLAAILLADEGAYNKAIEYSQQVVALEPESFTEAYEKQESSAFGEELNAEKNWRNHLITSGEFAGSKIEKWESEIGDIERLNDKRSKAYNPEAYKRRKFRIPPLRKAIANAQSTRGDWTSTLADVQGLSGPPGVLTELPTKPEAGSFGGDIFQTQMEIRDLGLHAQQSATEALSGLNELLKQENEKLRNEVNLHNAQAPILAEYTKANQPPYLGAYKEGGILPADGYYLGHKGEKVTPADQVGKDGGVLLLEPHIHLDGDLAALGDTIDARVELRERRTGKTVGLARATPSYPGRRANLNHGRKGS